jgi:hypothetical protein
VRTVRAQKDLSFVEVNDGSSLSGIQAVVTSEAEGASVLANGEITTGASVMIEGVVVESPGGKQKVEVKATSVRLVGGADASTFPLQKKRHTLEFLRGIAHLRPRTNTIGAVMRVRNQLAYATHTFFQSHDFTYVNTPIVTASDCEGAGEQFQVTTLLNGADGAAAAPAPPPASEADVAAAAAAAAEQGAVVKALKEKKKTGEATKEQVDEAVKTLLELKATAEAMASPAAPAGAFRVARSAPQQRRLGGLLAGFLQQAELLDRLRAAQRGDLRVRDARRVHVRSDVPRGELQHVAPPGGVLDGGARAGVCGLAGRHGLRRGVPEALRDARARALRRGPGVFREEHLQGQLKRALAVGRHAGFRAHHVHGSRRARRQGGGERR